MRVEMVRCDNPKCESTGMPEESGTAPYSWYEVSFYRVGDENLRIEVCSIDCVAPAMERVYHVRREEEMGG